MKKVLLSLFAFVALAVSAQNITVIGGCEFMVETDDATMTAKITDYEHEIDDAKFPMTVDRRKIKKFSVKGILEIPEKITVYGKEYTVTEIGRAAFADYTNIKTVKIPETVTVIGDYAFFRTSLHTVLLPAGLQQIGDRAFGRCENLRRLVCPKDIAWGVDVHAESKKVEVELIEGRPNLAQQPVKEAKKSPFAVNVQKPTIAKTITSDIDTNLPMAKVEASETFAVIIANENYQNDVAVDYALRDGRMFSEYCQKVLGLPKENVRFAENATLNNMKAMVNWIGNVAKAYRGKAQIIFYYAGHGMADDNNSASLLPIDGFAKDLSTGYSLQQLYTALGSLQAKNVCVFLDACFSGKQRNDEMLVAARGVRRVKNENPLGNMIVFSAAKGDETAHSYPDKGHGMFSYFLMKKLKETKGDVTLGELSDYIGENVEQKAVVVLNTVQTPSTSVSPRMKNSWRTMKLK